jgi:ADP-heptose:LPS heptosyltransferase
MIFKPKNKILYFALQIAELFLFAFDRIYFFFRRPSSRKRNSKVLIIRLDAIGDFIIWLSAAKAIRQTYAGSRVTLLGNELWTDLAKELRWFDAVWPLNRKKFLMNPLYRWKMLDKIQHEGFDIVLHPVFNRDFFVGDASVRASRAPTRIGFSGSTENIKPWHKKIGDAWYTALVPSGQKHQLDQDADFVRALGAPYTTNLPVLPPFPLKKDFPLKGDYYVIIPGAGHEMRQWPLGNFQEIARRIYKRTGLTGILCGGAREVNIGRAFFTGLSVPIMNMIGRTSLLDLVSIITHATFVVSNDTGAIHIAIAESVPSVCILGGAHPGRYLPYPAGLNARVQVVMHPMDCFNCDWHCVHKPAGVVPCVDDISADEVWNVIVEDILASYSPR